MEHTKISCQVNSYNNLFLMLKQLNDGNQLFKLMKINISSTTCRSVL